VQSEHSSRHFLSRNPILLLSVLLVAIFSAAPVLALSSSNIPLDSPVYGYLEKLAGMGLIKSDMRGLKPWTRAEAARLLLEAESTRAALGGASPFADQLLSRVREMLPREVALREHPEKQAESFVLNPAASARFRTVYLDGVPRSYDRVSRDPGHQNAFGIFGGDLRPFDGGNVRTTGTEGTPLLENNNGVIHPRGVSSELRWGAEGHGGRNVTAFLEPSLLLAEDESSLRLNRGYLKVGGEGLELEVGRDENWFGQGYRGTTTLTNNARNFDLVKLSSAEPVDVPWVRKWLGSFKYAVIFSRFDETDEGTPDHRQPWFLGVKLDLKPTDWFEIGANVVRQFGGPGYTGGSTATDDVFGGSENDDSNSIAGIDLRFTIESLRNTQFHWEFSGEDNAGGVWPIVESYVTGFFVPCLSQSCRDDFRFEYFYGSVLLYGNWKIPRGYVYHNMTPGHSQGGNAQEFFGRYSHWFGVRSNLALEYFYTERSRKHRTGDQAMESKHAGRAFLSLPLYGDIDGQLGYGFELIDNVNLVSGAERTNHLATVEIRYKY